METIQISYLSGVLASIILFILRIKTYKLNLLTIIILLSFCLLSWFGFMFILFGGDDDEEKEENKSGFKE